MHDSTGAWVGWGLGDNSTTVAGLKAFMKRKFSYASVLDGSTVFDATMQAVVAEMQTKYGIPSTGIVDYNTQVTMGYIKPAPPKPVVKPVIFTVEGHTSPWNVGPVASTGQAVEAAGLARWQPVNYNNNPIPFDNASGTAELARLLGLGVLDDGVPFPLGTPWVLCGFSQGAIVTTDFMVNFLQPGQVHNPRLKDLKGVLQYGDPCRSKGSVAPWSVAQAGPATNEGMDPFVRLDALGIKMPCPIMDVYRKGDLFADCEDTTTAEGQIKSAAYQLVARSDFMGSSDDVISQISSLFQLNLFGGGSGHLIDIPEQTFTTEVMGAVQALISAFSFLAGNPNPHYSPFDTSGGIAWVKSILGA